jgi:hypothetical protein
VESVGVGGSLKLPQPAGWKPALRLAALRLAALRLVALQEPALRNAALWRPVVRLYQSSAFWRLENAQTPA